MGKSFTFGGSIRKICPQCNYNFDSPTLAYFLDRADEAFSRALDMLVAGELNTFACPNCNARFMHLPAIVDLTLEAQVVMLGPPAEAIDDVTVARECASFKDLLQKHAAEADRKIRSVAEAFASGRRALVGTSIPVHYAQMLERCSSVLSLHDLAEIERHASSERGASRANVGENVSVAQRAYAVIDTIGGWAVLLPQTRYVLSRFIAATLMFCGDYERAMELFRKALTVLDADISTAEAGFDQRRLMIYASGLTQRLAFCAAMTGRHESAIEYLERYKDPVNKDLALADVVMDAVWEYGESSREAFDSSAELLNAFHQLQQSYRQADLDAAQEREGGRPEYRRSLRMFDESGNYERTIAEDDPAFAMLYKDHNAAWRHEARAAFLKACERQLEQEILSRFPREMVEQGARNAGLTAVQFAQRMTQQLAQQGFGQSVERRYVDHILAKALDLDVRVVQSELDGDEALVYLSDVGEADAGLAYVVLAEKILTVPLQGLGSEWLYRFLPSHRHAINDETWIGAYWNRDTSPTVWYDMLEQTSALLWQALQPLSEVLLSLPRFTAVEHITFIPSAYMAFLPWHAACNGSQALIDRFTISYLPTAAFRLSTKQRRYRQERDPNPLCAILDPNHVIGKRLPYARLEGLIVKELFSESRVFTGEQASRSTWDTLREAGVAHFAGHAIIDRDRPQWNGLALANQDAFFAREIVDSSGDLNARLVVLSGCDTGAIGYRSPDAGISLPQAFFYGGVSGVVSSMWAVDDRTSALLMIKFYHNWLREGFEPRVALRKSQIWLRGTTNAEKAAFLDSLDTEMKKPDAKTALDELFGAIALEDPQERMFSHPRFWASFMFAGS